MQDPKEFEKLNCPRLSWITKKNSCNKPQAQAMLLLYKTINNLIIDSIWKAFISTEKCTNQTKLKSNIRHNEMMSISSKCPQDKQIRQDSIRNGYFCKHERKATLEIIMNSHYSILSDLLDSIFGVYCMSNCEELNHYIEIPPLIDVMH